MPAMPHPLARRAARARRRPLAAGAVLVALALGGCDKCGNRIHLNVPGPQQSCGDNAQAPR